MTTIYCHSIDWIKGSVENSQKLTDSMWKRLEDTAFNQDEDTSLCILVYNPSSQ